MLIYLLTNLLAFSAHGIFNSKSEGDGSDERGHLETIFYYLRSKHKTVFAMKETFEYVRGRL